MDGNVLMRFSGLRPLEPFFCRLEDVEKGDVMGLVDLRSEDSVGVMMREESANCDRRDGRRGIWKVRASADRIEEGCMIAVGDAGSLSDSTSLVYRGLVEGGWIAEKVERSFRERLGMGLAQPRR